jgi:hypothetical protein
VIASPKIVDSFTNFVKPEAGRAAHTSKRDGAMLIAVRGQNR